jgi:TfoX/Sxy family transcriptional regulator of competence genes
MSRPSFEKSPPELVERFVELIATMPEVQKRSMFGYPCAFAGDQMATGLFGADWMIRLPEDGREELIAKGGAPFSPMPGRPTREYVTFPRSMLDDEQALRAWVERSLAYVRSLPPKPAKRPRDRASGPDGRPSNRRT